MIKTRKQLRELADKNGIIKRGSVSVKIWGNGNILRSDVDLQYTKLMTVKEAVELLKLNK